MIDIQKLIENGVQFGHQTWRWSPRMARYIWGSKNGVHLIDVSKTAVQLEKASKFLEEVAAEGKQILWVGTKKAAHTIVKDTAERLGCPYASNRWVGGTLTNFSQVKKSVTKLLHFEDVVGNTEKQTYTKKELGVFQKVVNRLQDNVGGVRSLEWPVGALIVIDAKKEATAIKEAGMVGLPVIALVDTNSDPSGVSIVIPGNDDVARSIRVIVDELAEAVARGSAAAKDRKVSAPQQSIAGAKEENYVATGPEEEEEGAGARRPTRARKPLVKGENVGLVVEEPTSRARRAPSSSVRPFTKDRSPNREGGMRPGPRADSSRSAAPRAEAPRVETPKAEAAKAAPKKADKE